MPSSVLSHTVPPFYVCYFLRSISVPGSTYIGSTPSPIKRKRQHNGEITQGALRTTRSRPWEMECIVYGFASKVAALQFEWAWAKPHHSRHLRAVKEVSDEASTSTSASVLPLFPATSMTPAFTKYGKPKRQKPRSPSTPNSRLLVLKALLRSEPFSGWGLRVAFFTEWSYGALQHLEKQRQQEVNSSRSGRMMHPSYPQIVCDFRGVDGKRKAIALLSEEERKEFGLKDLSSAAQAKRKSSSAKGKDVAEVTGVWSEQLPRSANIKALGLSLKDLAEAPVSMPPISAYEADLTQGKRKRKAAELTLEELEKRILQEDADQQLGPRMVFHDEDFAELHWRRFEDLLDSAKEFHPSLEDLIDAEIALSKGSRADDPQTKMPCGLCEGPVDMLDHTTYSTCPSPLSELLPRPLHTQTLLAVPPESTSCHSVFHLTCLADHFLASEQQPFDKEEFILPTHGTCPSPEHQAEPAYWSDVIRATYRRKDRFAQLVKLKLNNDAAEEPKVAIDEEDDDKEKGEDDEDYEDLEERPALPKKTKENRAKAAAPKEAKGKEPTTTKKTRGKAKKAVSEDSDSSLSSLSVVPIRKTRKKVTSAGVASEPSRAKPARKATAAKPTLIEVIDLT